MNEKELMKKIWIQKMIEKFGKENIIIIDETLQQRNSEIKQAFKRLLDSHVKNIPQFEIKELLQKLGLSEDGK